MKLYYHEFWDITVSARFIAGGISYEPFDMIPKHLYKDTRRNILYLLYKVGVLADRK